MCACGWMNGYASVMVNIHELSHMTFLSSKVTHIYIRLKGTVFIYDYCRRSTKEVEILRFHCSIPEQLKILTSSEAGRTSRTHFYDGELPL
jgi:hypothetical protein